MAKKVKEKEIDMEALANQKIVSVDLNNEMKKSYIAYAMSVIVSRALPDVRDGLKPVHRRILYDMYESGLLYESDFRKSATTVGDVLGKYHPHGDSSVYDAMVRLGQDFSLRYKLVQGKGNFGSIDGDPPAAYRYTESKMTKLAAEMLSDIEKETVDFVPNYDDSRREPGVLPSRFPNLLVNGSDGIAVGMATKIPPHNMREVVDGIIAVIDDPNISLDELMGYVKGPDFPTGAQIMGRSGIRHAYATGRGKIVMRAKAEIEEYENGRQRIVVSEIPYQVNKLRLERHINELMRDGKLEGITGTSDESTDKIHLVINLKRDANANVVLNNLYQYTQMQDTFGVILLALVDNEPKILTLREMIDYYIAHQEDVIRRRTRFDLKKAEEHAHLLEGYRTAIDYIDEVVHLIRDSKSIPAAKTNLMERFSLSEVQAQAIVQMPLGRLSGLERDKIEDDYNKTVAKINEFRDILANEHRILEIVKADLTAIRDKYGDERRTEIVTVFNELDVDDLIDEEDVTITFTHNGYTKRLPVDTYRSQRRGGRGISGLSTRDQDFVEHIFTTSTHNNLLFFSTRGIVYQLKAYQIPEAGRNARGTAIVNLLPLESGERITAVLPVSSFEDGKYLMFCTKDGTVKKTPLMDYSRIRNSGLRAIDIADGDELIGVMLTDGSKEIVLATNGGMAIRFSETDVRSMGRVSHGVRGIKLKEGDFVIGAAVIEDNTELLTVTENGFGKKTSMNEYKLQSRGGMGVLTYKITPKTGRLCGMETVSDENDVMIITSGGVVIRIHADDISSYSRVTQGVRLMRMDDGVTAVSITKTDRGGQDSDEDSDNTSDEDLDENFEEDSDIAEDAQSEDTNNE